MAMLYLASRGRRVWAVAADGAPEARGRRDRSRSWIACRYGSTRIGLAPLYMLEEDEEGGDGVDVEEGGD